MTITRPSKFAFPGLRKFQDRTKRQLLPLGNSTEGTTVWTFFKSFEFRKNDHRFSQSDGWSVERLRWLLDPAALFNQGLGTVNLPAEQTPKSEFGALVFDETIRRIRRQSPQIRLDLLRAALRDAEARQMIPKRDRAAHEKRLLWLIQDASSKS